MNDWKCFTVYVWVWVLGLWRNWYFCSKASNIFHSRHWQLPIPNEDFCMRKFGLKMEGFWVTWRVSCEITHFYSEGPAMRALHIWLDWTDFIAWWIPKLTPGHRFPINHLLPLNLVPGHRFPIYHSLPLNLATGHIFPINHSLPVHWKSPLNHLNHFGFLYQTWSNIFMENSSK